MFSNFFRTLQTDWIKYRRSLLPWACLAYMLLVVFLVFIFTMGDKRKPNNATFLFVRNISNVSAFFLPYFLVLIISLLTYIEHRGQGWKLMYSQPVSRGYFYVSKLVVLLIVLLMVVFLKFILSSLAVKLLELSKHQIKASDFLRLYKDFIIPDLIVILSCSALIAIQYWMSIRLKNFILPTAIGTIAAILPLAVLMILGIAGIISSPEKLGQLLKFDPYSLPYSFVFDFSQLQNKTAIARIPTQFVIGSVIAGIVIGTAGFFDNQRRNIH